VTVEREVAPDLAPVWADRDQVLQLLLNLFRNALDAMPGGGTLVLSARAEGEFAALSVKDSGSGIAAVDLPHVFEPYFTKKEGGTGLGLAIAQRIAEEHGGKLSVESRPGAGATFTLHLPSAKERSPGESGPASKPAEDAKATLSAWP
jgi:signal transduction histidine kinase